MKKSELYQMAMKAVLRADYNDDQKIEIIDALLANKKMAEWEEKTVDNILNDGEQKGADNDGK